MTTAQGFGCQDQGFESRCGRDFLAILYAAGKEYREQASSVTEISCKNL